MPDDVQSSTIERTLALLELLRAAPGGLSVPDLLARLEMPRSTLFGLLHTLKRLGYIEQAEKRGRYRAGVRLQAWRGGQGGSNLHLLAAFFQEAEALHLKETLGLALPVMEGALLLAQVEGASMVRAALPENMLLPAESGVDQVLTASPPKVVAVEGYCLAVTDEVIYLSLPVCSDGCHPDAAVLLCVPALRWTPDRLLEETLPNLRQVAARLSYRLGAPDYAPYQASDGLPAELAIEERTTSLTPAEIEIFLRQPWTARLACLRPDGKPHVIPVWQEWDGSSFAVIAWEGSLWAEHVLQNPAVSLAVDEPWRPLRRVSARGAAIPLEGGSDGLTALVNRLARRYLGRAASPSLLRKAQRGFRIVPESLRGWKGMPG
ncbi:MAG TPA: helix-turn-helix domain-containing protein [Anaerolineaceae bacterium]